MAPFKEDVQTQKSSPKSKKTTKKILPVLALASICLSSCSYLKSNPQSNMTDESGIVISDPFEKSNRMVMKFNQTVDKAVIYPTVRTYRKVAPSFARKAIRNVLRNFNTPVIFVNQVLQGDMNGAGNALKRLAINTTLGLGGMVDLAGHEGIEYEHEDFGQTLAVWGLDNGPYIVAPFIGPSSFRDYTGYFVDSMSDPLGHYFTHINKQGYNIAKFGVNYLDIRDSLMDTQIDLEETSIDDYAAIRSTYYQYRAALVKDLKISDIPDIPDYDDYE